MKVHPQYNYIAQYNYIDVIVPGIAIYMWQSINFGTDDLLFGLSIRGIFWGLMILGLLPSDVIVLGIPFRKSLKIGALAAIKLVIPSGRSPAG